MSDEIDERKPYLDILFDWFSTNLRGIKPHKKREYAQLFYNNDLTTERRILSHSTRYPNWLREQIVDDLSYEDIIEYLQTKGLVLTPSAAHTSGKRISFIAWL